MIKYSFIIPYRNESEKLSELVGVLTQFPEKFEIIISSCGVIDEALVKNPVVKVIESDYCSRGEQLNAGADAAKGEIFVFVHADTIVKENSLKKLIKTFNDPSVQVATFCLGFDKNNWLLNVYSYFSKFDSVFTTFGDQIICVKKNVFNSLGRFPNYRMMEDVAFLRTARRKFKIKKIDCKIITSAERFVRNGYIKTQIKNLIYLIKFLLGGDPDKIYDKYYA